MQTVTDAARKLELTLENCDQCPYLRTWSGICSSKCSYVDDTKAIPAWCPLPLVKEKELVKLENQ